MINTLSSVPLAESDIIHALAGPVARVVNSVMRHTGDADIAEPQTPVQPTDIILGAADENLKFWLRANGHFSAVMSEFQQLMNIVQMFGDLSEVLTGESLPNFGEFMLLSVLRDFCTSISAAFVIDAFGDRFMNDLKDIDPSQYGLGVRTGYVVVLVRRGESKPEADDDLELSDLSPADPEEN